MKNKAWLENFPKIFNSDPTHIVAPVRRNRFQVPVHPLNTLDFEITDLKVPVPQVDLVFSLAKSQLCARIFST